MSKVSYEVAKKNVSATLRMARTITVTNFVYIISKEIRKEI